MNDWLIAGMASGTIAAAIVAMVVRGSTKEPSSVARLPALLRLSSRGARVVAAQSRWSLPERAERSLGRLLARAGFVDDIDARHWTALLVCNALCWAALGLLLIAWLGAPMSVGVVLPLLSAWQGHAWLAGRARTRTSELERELPSGIDLLVLCLESGASLGTAIRIAHEKSTEGAVRDLFASLLRQIRNGQDRATAFCRVRDQLDIPAVSGLLTALIQADSRGMSLGPALRAQSAQCVADRFVRAERAAMQAPVRLLLPLLAFIFPCTFIVIAVPIAARLVGQGGP